MYHVVRVQVRQRACNFKQRDGHGRQVGPASAGAVVQGAAVDGCQQVASVAVLLQTGMGSV